MIVSRRFLLAGGSALALAACTDQYGRELEAGAEIDEGQFGNPTMFNHKLQTGEIDYVTLLARRFAAEVPSMVNFAFDSAELDPEARAILRHQARWIRRFPELRFKVYGHTDLVGSARYNHHLGLRRAHAVMNFLIESGVPRNRLTGVVSRGQTQPLIVTEGRERANRRTVTEVSGFVRRHPTVMDGQYAEIIRREYVGSATTPHGRILTPE